MIHSKDELLDYVIRYMAENSLEMNTFEQMKFACFADWLQKQNFCKPDVSGRCSSSGELPMPNNKIVFSKYENNIGIIIPIPLLKFAAENHPTDPLVVKDEQQFAEKVMFELEHNLGSDESGHSGFEELLDEAMQEVAVSGHDFVDLKEVEW